MMEQQPLEHPLRKWRKAKGLTLQKCAEAVGTSRMVWSDWERWRRRPNKHFMPKVRALTGGEITADDFFPSLDQGVEIASLAAARKKKAA